MTEEEQGQAAELAVELPDVDDVETFDLMTSFLNPAVVVAAVRSLSKEVRAKILSFCGDLRTLFQGGDDLSPATG